MNKNKLLFFFAFFSFIILFAQNKDAKKSIFEKKNELKIDMLSLLAQPAVEIEYERILNSWNSTGAYIKYGDGGLDLSRKFRLGSFYRGYFTQSKEYGTKGFYAEILAGYYVGEGYYLDYTENNQSGSTTYKGFEGGFKLGYKWVNKTGFVLQADIGLSRGLIKDEYSPENFLLSGIKIGWRF